MGVKENFTKPAIAEQLKRILSAPAFKSSRILSGFLEFIIDKTLAGEEQEIKEYTIGVHVLSRNNDFNPQLDTIVRTHAGRLRRALKEYYYEMGKHDPILIEIPLGSYIPFFLSQNGVQHTEVNEKKDKAPASKKPVVAVLPFRNISSNGSRDFFADGLGDQLSTELTRFPDLSIISYHSSRHAAGKTGDLKEAAMLLGASYVLTGSIQTDTKHLRISAQLISPGNGEQLWAKSFDQNNTASDLFEIQNEIVKSILTAVGGYYGAIFRDVMKAPYQANSMETYDAIFWYYNYQRVFTKEVYQKAISALESAVKNDPNYALAWAMLGELYIDDKAMEFEKNDDPLEKGLECAQRAIAIDPTCQHGYLALAWIYLFYHNREESLKAADQCITINPNSADKTAAMGFAIICAGEFEKGFALLNHSVHNNPFSPWWHRLAFVFYFLNKKEYHNAFQWLLKLNKPDAFWDPMMKASVLGHLNRTEEARKNLDLLIQLMPDTANHVKGIIESFILSQNLNNEIMEGLKKAGLNAENERSPKLKSKPSN